MVSSTMDQGKIKGDAGDGNIGRASSRVTGRRLVVTFLHDLTTAP